MSLSWDKAPGRGNGKAGRTWTGSRGENEWVNWHQRACSEGLGKREKRKQWGLWIPHSHTPRHTLGSWGTRAVLRVLKELLCSPSNHTTARNQAGAGGVSDTPELRRWWKESGCSRALRIVCVLVLCLERLGRKWTVTSLFLFVFPRECMDLGEQTELLVSQGLRAAVVYQTVWKHLIF